MRPFNCTNPIVSILRKVPQRRLPSERRRKKRVCAGDINIPLWMEICLRIIQTVLSYKKNGGGGCFGEEIWRVRWPFQAISATRIWYCGCHTRSREMDDMIISWHISEWFHNKSGFREDSVIICTYLIQDQFKRWSKFLPRSRRVPDARKPVFYSDWEAPRWHVDCLQEFGNWLC